MSGKKPKISEKFLDNGRVIISEREFQRLNINYAEFMKAVKDSIKAHAQLAEKDTHIKFLEAAITKMEKDYGKQLAEKDKRIKELEAEVKAKCKDYSDLFEALESKKKENAALKQELAEAVYATGRYAYLVKDRHTDKEYAKLEKERDELKGYLYSAEWSRDELKARIEKAQKFGKKLHKHLVRVRWSKTPPTCGEFDELIFLEEDMEEALRGD